LRKGKVRLKNFGKNYFKGNSKKVAKEKAFRNSIRFYYLNTPLKVALLSEYQSLKIPMQFQKNFPSSEDKILPTTSTMQKSKKSAWQSQLKLPALQNNVSSDPKNISDPISKVKEFCDASSLPFQEPIYNDFLDNGMKKYSFSSLLLNLLRFRATLNFLDEQFFGEGNFWK